MELSSLESDNQQFEFLSFKARRRAEAEGYPLSDQYVERMNYELGIILECGFVPYFLIVADLCDFMRDRGIRFVVRGSGCGSVVVWYLGISHHWLDPVRYKLPFERFLNPSRVSNPDLDIDIQDDRRQEVFDYTVEKYGQDRVAKLISFGTLKARAAIKDVARVRDIPQYAQVASEINAGIPLMSASLDDALDGNEYLQQQERMWSDLFRDARVVEGKVRNATVHAAGVIVAPDSLIKFMPMYWPSPSTRHDESAITQWDMYDSEARGLLKMDYLGLKSLRVIEQTQQLINRYRESHGLPRDFNIDLVDRWDKPTWDLLASGRLAGVFQVEREFVRNFAKRMSLGSKLGPDTMEEWKIPILISIIRPGMMDTGATETYLQRANGEAPVVPIIPKLGELGTLQDSYNLIIFQEDCMWVARDLAGFTMSEADSLRRAIGKKKASEMAKIKPTFVTGCISHSGITEDEALHVWSQMETFARYGFNSAHAAAYGLVIAYQTAYLKANYPLEFMATLINSESGATSQDEGYNYKVAEYVAEARNMGITIEPPDLRRSQAMCTINPEKKSILFGLSLIKGVGHKAVDWITSREETRNAATFSEFLMACFEHEKGIVNKVRTKKGERFQVQEEVTKSFSRVGRSDLLSLIDAGALDCFVNGMRSNLRAAVDHDCVSRVMAGGRTKSTNLLEMVRYTHEHLGKLIDKETPKRREQAESLLSIIEDLPIEDIVGDEDSLEDRLTREHTATGCYLSQDPFTPFRAQFDRFVNASPADLIDGAYPETSDADNPASACFYGLLVSARPTVVKQGKSQGRSMGFVKFTGVAGELECVCFSDTWETWEKSPGGIEHGKVYLVTTTPDRKRNGHIVQQVRRLSSLEM